MDAFFFNFLRYFLLFLFVLSGLNIKSNYLNDLSISSEIYWRNLLPPILLYSFMEGTRWGRGTDYFYNYDIANLRTTSGDWAYDSFAKILNVCGFPWWIFFVIISALLICSLYCYIKPFYEAVVPTIVLLYQFTMGQSENLMRQYTAISIMLFSLYFFHEKKYYKSMFLFALAYLIHSSVVFIVPFFMIALMIKIIPQIRNIKIVQRLDLLFLMMFFASPILTKLFESNIEYLYNLLGVGLNEKYLSETYLLRATEEADSNGNLAASVSVLNNVRTFVRSVIVIFVGKRVLDIYLYKDKRYFIMYFSWFFACCGIVYFSSLPHLKMEVVGRLALYLQVFIYVVEGYVIYTYFEKKRFCFDEFGNKISLAVKLLVLMELVPILKWQTGSVLGLKFIW